MYPHREFADHLRLGDLRVLAVKVEQTLARPQHLEPVAGLGRVALLAEDVQHPIDLGGERGNHLGEKPVWCVYAAAGSRVKYPSAQQPTAHVESPSFR